MANEITLQLSMKYERPELAPQFWEQWSGKDGLKINQLSASPTYFSGLQDARSGPALMKVGDIQNLGYSFLFNLGETNDILITGCDLLLKPGEVSIARFAPAAKPLLSSPIGSQLQVHLLAD